ncbi:hypothetical protein ACVWWP_000967 [Bradyrhizobium sp. LM3.6]
MCGLDAFSFHPFEDEAARNLPGIAHGARERDAAAKPRHGDCGIERVAAADLREMGGIRLAAARGHGLDPKGQVAHGNADAEDARRDP